MVACRCSGGFRSSRRSRSCGRPGRAWPHCSSPRCWASSSGGSRHAPSVRVTSDSRPGRSRRWPCSRDWSPGDRDRPGRRARRPADSAGVPADPGARDCRDDRPCNGHRIRRGRAAHRAGAGRAGLEFAHRRRLRDRGRPDSDRLRPEPGGRWSVARHPTLRGMSDRARQAGRRRRCRCRRPCGRSTITSTGGRRSDCAGGAPRCHSTPDPREIHGRLADPP